MKNKLQIFEEAKNLIEDPNNWCEGSFAADKYGKGLDNWNHSGAVKFCAIGAVLKTSSKHFKEGDKNLGFQVIDILDSVSNELFKDTLDEYWDCNKYDTDIELINDELGHEAVMKVFNAAIEKEKNK